jgi:hypothetical protein
LIVDINRSTHVYMLALSSTSMLQKVVTSVVP